ncbi:NAD(P)H-binding protein [Symbioplanes lichenis]|uniref:NAD(P)H-binding protein n=1 Tax=Symbioplanes lichenis TaxID=1629072 RepID=UPI00273910B0|nr:NAD(P)H-binding protein [Actinoplanes lichenis]
MVQPVLVTGGTGGIGGLVVDELVAAGVPVRALVRDPGKAGFPSEVEVVRGDLTDPGSLDGALRDVGAVFLVWTLPFDTAPAVIEEIARHTSRVVFLSSPHNVPHPFFQQPNAMARVQADIERLIRESGLAATILRPGMFASNALHWWAPAIRDGRPVRWPYADVETAPVDDRDVAAVAARALTDANVGGDHVLTGPESLSQAEQLRVLAPEATFEELTPDQWRDETAGSWPRPVVDMLLAAWGAAEGQPAYVSSGVAAVLGRPARTFRQWAEDHAASVKRS